jgi:hypothetical protein
VEIDHSRIDREIAIGSILLLSPSVAALLGLVARRPRGWSPWAVVGWMIAGYVAVIALLVGTAMITR